MHTQGKLRLGNVAHYMAQFERDTPHISLEDRAPVPAGRPAKKRRLTRLQKSKTTLHDWPEDAPYEYQPLAYRSFRLLELSPGNHDSPLRGTLVNHSLPSSSSPVTSASPTYTALSYQWGIGLTPFKLSTHEGSIAITLSLDRALRRVRNPAHATLVWADAVCINQLDEYEKRAQIRLMKDIFESASEVCAYLGPGDEASDRAMETLIQICNAHPDDDDDENQRGRSRKTVTTSLCPTSASGKGRGAPDEDDPVWKDIRMVLDRGWFHRVWVVQEAVLARDLVLYCGDRSMRWEHIWKAIKTCMALPGFLSAVEREHGLEMPAYTLGLVRERLRGPAACPYGLLTLLHVFAHTQASRSVDKLFGLLSLAPDAGDAAFDPDYCSPKERVARRYAAAFVERGHAVELLCRASGLRSPGLPSWVPDWTSTTRPETISTWYGPRGLFTASKRSDLDASVDRAGNLRVRATQLDRIGTVGGTAFETSSLFAFLASIQSDIDDALLLPTPPGTYPHTGETRHQLALSLPVGGTSRPHPCHNAITNHLKFPVLDGGPTTSAFLDITDNAAANKAPLALLDLSAIPVIACIQDLLNFLKKPPPARQNVWSYWQTVTAFSRRLGNSRFFAYAPGDGDAAVMRVGVGPSETEVGDELWIVHGMATPVVLRPRPRPTRMTAEGVEGVRVPEYELVGEAYVHDPRIMYGEELESMGGGCSKMVALV